MHLQLARLLLISILALAQQQDPSKPSPNSDPQKTQDSAASTAPATPSSAASGAPTGMAACYIYRPRINRGAGERIGLFIDGTMAANVVNGRWVSLQVPPGHHAIKPKDNQSGAEVDMEPGKEYYFKTSWGEQGMFHGAHKLLIPVMKEQAVYEIKQLKPLDRADSSWPIDQPGASSKQ
jgi:hypothetical protein